MKVQIGIGLLVFFAQHLLCAQTVERDVLSNGGGSFSGSGFQVDYTVGELAVNTLTNLTYTLTQGFQQPLYDTLTSIFQLEDTEYTIFCYPNPVNDIFTLELFGGKLTDARLELMDLNGRILLEDNIIYHSDHYMHSYNIEDLPPNFYFLSILSDNRQIAGYKLIKK